MMSLDFESARLRFRPLADDDIDLALELFTDAEVSRFIGGAMTEDDVAAEMANWVRRCAGGVIGVWCVVDKSTGEKLGTSGVLPLPIDAPDTEYERVQGPDIPDGEIELGYILKPPAWGRGIATETCGAQLRFIFENSPIETVVAVTDPDHSRSQNVLRKSGFSDTGPRRAYADDGVPGFRITRSEWLERYRAEPASA